MSETTGPLQRTPLFDFHERHHAHLTAFAGWEMPLYYESIVKEHEAVRTGLGLFDVSHMGVLTVAGGHAADLLSHRTTANVDRLEPGQVRYTFLLDATGMIVDDLLITRLDDGTAADRSFLVVPNAAHAVEVYDLLRSHRRPDTEVGHHNGEVAILAVQGPKARATLEGLFGWNLGGLRFYHARGFPAARDGPGPTEGRLAVRVPQDLDRVIWASRTGYTGEAGYELFVPGARADAIAERIVAAGAKPIGLGARDTLRLEKGYLLSGQDFHGNRTPLDAAQERFVEFDHAFVGRPVLDQQKLEGTVLRFAGLTADEPSAIPRPGMSVRHEGKTVGTVTSGAQSPTLKIGIALAYLPTALAVPGTPVTFDIRGREAPGKVVPLPFYPPPGARR